MSLNTHQKQGRQKTATKTPGKRNLASQKPQINLVEPGATVPDPAQDLNGWANVVLYQMREQALRGILHLKAEALSAMENQMQTAGDEADMSAARDEKQARLLSLGVLQDRLSEIDAAIGRLGRGEYGICEETGEEIPLERLRANPLAQTTIEAQSRREMARRMFSSAKK